MAGLDFSELGKSSATDTATEPRRIFAALPSKDAKYSYPRDVQSEVWEEWHARRTSRDLVVKMNTGGGKTVVGLMLLKSSLNEGVGPAIYITPDNYLVAQVCSEARDLGIETTTDPHSGRFQSGKAILVVNIYKVVNGRSVFGVVGDARPRIKIGTAVIDDAHACLATVQQQFTLHIKSDHPCSEDLRELLAEDLYAQSPSSARDIAEGVRSAVIRVPYWAWANNSSKIMDILHPHRDDPEFQFVWPLLKDCLHLCLVAFSADGWEIRPPCPPLNRIASISEAQRRIFLTATLADDSVLITHFSVDVESLAKPITPRTADDLGDRMILTPLETFPSISDDEIRRWLADEAKRNNVVVIVPSQRRANEWEEYADGIFRTSTIHQAVESLRAGHVGLVVLINRYDGIDLPGKACRILVIDGLPEAYGSLDRLEALALGDSDAMVTRQIQRIEQGMGRGVRSNDDYCVVVLLGARLTQRLHEPSSRAKLSAATRAQIALSERVAEMLTDRAFEDLPAVVNQCLARDTNWVKASRDALDGLIYDPAREIPAASQAERQSFDLAEMRRYAEAARLFQAPISATADQRYRGWLKQQSAAYLHFVDPGEAQSRQLSALNDNRTLIKPREGVSYHRMTTTTAQAERATSLMSERFRTGNELIIGADAILEDLIPNEDVRAVSKFEQAMQDLGEFLGFGTQMPERDIGEGPDVLWLLGQLKYLVIECKSGATTDFISKHDAAQLSHSMDWFRENYDVTCSATPILIHPSSALHPKATGRAGTRIITFDRLKKLREAVRSYVAAIAQSGQFHDAEQVSGQIKTWNLAGNTFVSHWAVPTRKHS